MYNRYQKKNNNNNKKKGGSAGSRRFMVKKHKLKTRPKIYKNAPKFICAVLQ